MKAYLVWEYKGLVPSGLLSLEVRPFYIQKQFSHLLPLNWDDCCFVLAVVALIFNNNMAFILECFSDTEKHNGLFLGDCSLSRPALDDKDFCLLSCTKNKGVK